MYSKIFNTKIKEYDPWQPNDYAQNSELQYQWAMELLCKAPLHEAKTLLDIGSGDGKITSEIAQRAPETIVVGIDLSPSMIHYAKRKFNESLYPNLRFLLQDVRSLNFNAQFDMIVSFTCLHWVKDQMAVLKGIKRSLKPSGRVFLGLVSGIDSDFEEVLQETITSERWENRFIGFRDTRQYFTATDYSEFLQAVDLSPRRLETIESTEYFTSRQRFSGWIRNWMPHKNRLSHQETLEFIEEIIDCFLVKKRVEANASIPFLVRRLEVETQLKERVEPLVLKSC